MKRLFLLRHAEAADHAARMRDFDRPLTEKGRADAALIGDFLAKGQNYLEAALCSPSVRTRETLEIVASRLPDPPAIIFEDAIYNATQQQLLRVIQDTPDKFTQVLLVGHNPGMHLIALALSSSGDAKALKRLSKSFPKGALAEIEFAITSWRDTEFTRGGLAKFTRPKQLRI